jgi:hypothetical protein
MTVQMASNCFPDDGFFPPDLLIFKNHFVNLRPVFLHQCNRSDAVSIGRKLHVFCCRSAGFLLDKSTSTEYQVSGQRLMYFKNRLKTQGVGMIGQGLPGQENDIIGRTKTDGKAWLQ